MATKHSDEETEEDQKPLVIRAKDTLLLPARLAISRPARRAYLTTLLILTTSTLLLALAVIAYTLFYHSYIPYLGFSVPLHLQYDDVYPSFDTTRTPFPHPYGLAELGTDIVSRQEYDVGIELRLPRTKGNRDAGNFMVEVTLYAPREKKAEKGVLESVKDGFGREERELTTAAAVLARSRRAAMLTYRAEVTEWIWRFTELHWYLLGWRQEAETIDVRAFESVEFVKGWRNVPATLRLEVQSRERLQLYGAKAVFRAKLRGLRWVMWNYRVASFFVFVGGFWATEMVFAGLVWGVIALIFASDAQEVKAEKVHEVAEHLKEEKEEDDFKAELSDTERTFPTTRGQQRLHYQSPTIKQEEGEVKVLLPDISTRATEADDEDEGADFVLDSGLGTSMESSASRRDSVRKRRGRLSYREER